MTEEHERCHAITKAGSQCKNNAHVGSIYCGVHKHYGGTTTQKVDVDNHSQDTSLRTFDPTELQSLLAELNELTEELNRLVPDYSPPEYSPQRMLDLLKGDLDRMAPEAVKDMAASLEGTSLEDFRDIETWKGMWFTLNYLVKLEASERADSLSQRLSGLPGVNTLLDLQEMLADTPPEEFLKVDTWKGVWFIANYELQNQAQSIRARLLGPHDES